MKKKLLMIVAMLLMFTTVSACSDEKVDSLERVKKEEKLTVVGSGGYPPFNYMKDGEVVGFDVEVGEEIAKRLGVKLNYVTSDWDGLVEGLRNKRYDGILGSMAITKDRLKVVNFTTPYYYSGAQLFVLKDSKITKADEMKGKKIAVTTGSNFVQDAKELGAEVAYYQDDNATMMELINGRVDGVITDRLVGINAMNEMKEGEKIIMVDSLLRLESMGIAINKDDKELLKKIDEILEAMHEDGTMKAISEKWMNGTDITVK